jgi:hypothetical protein
MLNFHLSARDQSITFPYLGQLYFWCNQGATAIEIYGIIDRVDFIVHMHPLHSNYLPSRCLPWHVMGSHSQFPVLHHLK